jgi:hypothetical protein
MTSDSTIPVSTATRLKANALKRGGESYDDFINKALDQYEPDTVEEDASAVTGAN